MKMVMAIVPRDEAERVLQALVAANHTATFVETRGGMLRQAQMTLFIAAGHEDLEQVLGVIERTCHSEPVVESVDGEEEGPIPVPTRPELGGAVVFVWDIHRSENY